MVMFHSYVSLPEGIYVYDTYLCIYIYIYLVGGFEHDFFDFPDIGNVIIPTDFHIFQRGWNHQPDIYISLLFTID